MAKKMKIRNELIFFGVVVIFISLSFNLLSLAYAEPQITFNTKDTSYGHDLIIRGNGFAPNSEYLIKLIMPNGLEIHLKQGLTNGDDFGVIQPIEFGAVVGNYTVIIETESEKATNFFTITREPYSIQQTITVEEKEFVVDYTPYVGNVGEDLEKTLQVQKDRILLNQQVKQIQAEEDARLEKFRAEQARLVEKLNQAEQIYAQHVKEAIQAREIGQLDANYVEQFKQFRLDYANQLEQINAEVDELVNAEQARLSKQFEQTQSKEFEEIIDTPIKEIPSWVKEVFKMWTNGQITDTDLINGIQYLIKIRVIVV